MSSDTLLGVFWTTLNGALATGETQFPRLISFEKPEVWAGQRRLHLREQDAEPEALLALPDKVGLSKWICA